MADPDPEDVREEEHEEIEQNQRDIMDELDGLHEKFDQFSDSVIAQLEGLHERVSELEGRVVDKLTGALEENAAKVEAAIAAHAIPQQEDDDVSEGIHAVAAQIGDLDKRLDEIEDLLEEDDK